MTMSTILRTTSLPAHCTSCPAPHIQSTVKWVRYSIVLLCLVRVVSCIVVCSAVPCCVVLYCFTSLFCCVTWCCVGIRHVVLYYVVLCCVVLTFLFSNFLQTFPGNTDQNTTVHHDIFPVIVALKIRIHPVSWKNHASLRVDFIGCFRDNLED